MVASNTAFRTALGDSSPRLKLTGSFEEMTSEREGIAGRIGFDTPSNAAGIDRRVHPRQNVSLRVSGRRLDHSVEAMREPMLNINLCDVSVGGLKATSQTRLNVGERVAVYFPPSGGKRGWDAYGRVVRVEPSNALAAAEAAARAACTVAVEFDAFPAA